MDVTVLNRQRTHPVPRRALTEFLGRLSTALPPDSADSLAVCLVSDRRMREYNRRFRERDTTTDVLAFPAAGIADADEHPLGDILISVDTAVRQARAAGHGLGRELKTLALHGYLHLLGYDHETDDGRMLRLQRKLEAQLMRRGTGGSAA